MELSVDVLCGLLAAAPDALLALNANGEIVFVNDQAERLFGWSKADLLGRGIDCLVPERFPDRVPTRVPARHRSPRVSCGTFVTGHPMGQGLQLSARRKDGSAFPAEISLSQVIDDLGAGLVMAAVRDASNRIELEAQRQRQALADQREQSQRLESLGQLAGGVAHDFNNLLGVIFNYTTLLGRRVTEPTAVADLAEIRAAAERAAGLTRQLLTFARRDVANPEALELNDIVRGVASMLARTLDEEIELCLDLGREPLVTVADRHQLEQIVLNLVINARDAMATGGRLTISTARSPCRDADPPANGTHEPSSRVVLKVMDAGHGMCPEVAARAFEPFFTTKPQGHGTGLGLATVYGIVRQNGGDITIDTAVGVGTTVTVVLPGADGATPQSAPAMEVSEDGRHERVLLVEDEDALRAGTARILVERGYEVLVASDGVEALEVLDRATGSVDVVVTDVVMPRMRGDALARELEGTRPGVPVIFLSGYDSGDARLRGQLLAKPVAADVLLRTIREVLNGSS